MSNEPRSGQQPLRYPSIPDHDSEPPRHNEAGVAGADDRTPPDRFVLGDSRADLRIRVERLLQHKDAASAEDWAALGAEGRAMLVDLLDDPTVRSNPELLRRVVATTGLIGVRRAIAPLGGILNDSAEEAITRAQAANALGRIGEPAALDALASATIVKDDVVRRQVAIALGRLGREAALPHLLVLQRDQSIAVAEAAADALGRRTSGSPVESGRTRRKRTPNADG